MEGLIKNTEFFTTSELADKLKMNVQVITRKVQAGDIKAYKIGKEWRIPEQSVYEWLESNVNSRRSITGRERTATTLVDDGSQVRQLPAQRSNRKYLLEYILAQFEPNRVYAEQEVDRTIARYNDDVSTVRREFIAEGMMDRTNGKYRRRTGYRLSD
jgi:excisionase family DNA binding protein